MSRKASADGIIKALSGKANSQDVTEGFSRLKNFIEDKLSSRNNGGLQKEDVIAIINQHLMINGGQEFSYDGFYHSQTSLALNQTLDKRLQTYVTKKELERQMETERACMASKSMAEDIRAEIFSCGQKIESIDAKFELRMADLSSEVKSSEDRAFTRESEMLENIKHHFALRNDFSFLKETEYSDLKAKVSQLDKSNAEARIKKLESQSKEMLDHLNTQLETMRTMTTKLNQQAETVKLELKSEALNFKNELVKSFANFNQNKRNTEEEVFTQIHSHIAKLKSEVMNISDCQNILEKKLIEKCLEFKSVGEDFKRLRQEYSGLKLDIDQKLSKATTTDSEHVTIEDLREQFSLIEKLEDSLNLFKQQTDRKHKNTKLKFTQIDETLSLLVDSVRRCPLEKDITKLQANASSNQEVYKQLSELIPRVTNLETLLKGTNKESQNSTAQINRSSSPQHFGKKRKLGTKDQALAHKSDLVNIYSVLDQKADIESVNKLIAEIHEELDELPEKEQLDSIFIAAEKHIPVLLTKALWLWKSGKTVKGIIPWEVECFNHMPQCFTFGKTNSEVIIREEGLYEFSFGFFSRKKATVDVYLNGEVAISTRESRMNDASAKFENRHSSGYAVGNVIRNNIL